MVVVVKFLNVLTTCREYGNRLAKYLIGSASGLIPTLLNSFPCAHGECRSSHARLRSVVRGPLVLEGVALIHKLGRKVKSCMCDSESNHVTCALDVPCKVKKLDSNCPLLAANETA